MRHVFLKVNTMIGDAGVQMLGICQDITERKQGEEELRQLSVLDELTGLNNRRGFLILATQQLKMSDRSKQGAVLVYADMDKMKWVNDTLGHKEGDRALIDIANILKSGLRASDIIARWGGDEFVALALESSEKAAEVILTRLREKLAAHNSQGHRSYKLSVSFGLTGYDPENPCALEELLERGDKLMYEEKQKRKMQRT
jgi:diguanylate cyclase (GGDEF)-like protein